MKNLLRNLLLLPMLLSLVFFTSCADDNTGLEDGGEGSTSYKLNVTSTDLTPKLNIVSATNKIETVKVHFEGTDNPMRRLYITKNNGTGRVIYNINNNVVPPVTLNNDDQSIDLKSDKKNSFTFDIPFEAPKTNNGVVVYKLWTTHSPFLNSKGDIENAEFRNSYEKTALGTIVIKAGSTASASSPVKEFSAKLLYAPTKDGKNKSFISILNGKVSKIVQQDQKDVTDGTVFTAEEKSKNAQYVSYWDFGYFYTNSKGASLSSTHDYMNAFTSNGKPVIDITNMSGLTKDKLNKFYFKKDNTINFDTFKTSSDLSGLSINTSSPQTINNLTKGDLVQFLSENGIKGLIRVDEIKAGFESNKYIKFSVKVQNFDYIKL